MPELPDLVYIEKRLFPLLKNKKIIELEVFDPVVIRNMAGGDLNSHLNEKKINEVRRHGPFLRIDLDGGWCIVVHFMLAGKFSVREQARDGVGGDRKRKKASLCFSLHLENIILDYIDEKRMGKVYFCTPGHLKGIPGYDPIGPDLLGADFTPEYFLTTLGKNRRQARVFLKDHSLVNSVGNAYADEILFEAGIHPKRRCNTLSETEKSRFFEAIRTVIRRGIEAVEQADRGIDAKVRDHMKVRNRRNQPCPVCGTKIRRAIVLGYDAFYCPSCQPMENDLFGKLHRGNKSQNGI